MRRTISRSSKAAKAAFRLTFLPSPLLAPLVAIVSAAMASSTPEPEIVSARF